MKTVLKNQRYFSVSMCSFCWSFNKILFYIYVYLALAGGKWRKYYLCCG